MINLARFFLQAGQLNHGQAVISGDDAHHITRVLRLQRGNIIECVDEEGQVHLVKIQELGETVRGLMQETLAVSQESSLHMTLFQGLAKGDKMDFIIQKAVELGVAEIVPFTSRYTVVKLDAKGAKSRQERWERIALEAAKQCRRTRLPIVRELQSFSSLVSGVQIRHQGGCLALLAYEGEKQTGLKELTTQPQAAAVIIGPEGGFARDEVEELMAAGAQALSLGPRILRTETAGLVFLSMLGYKWGDLG